MFTDIDNLRINYYDSKKNEDVILFLHGWGSNYEVFKFLFPYLQEKFRILALDLPGFGESSIPLQSFCADDYANFCIEFLDSIFKSDNNSKKNIILIGHSNGGRIAIKLNLKTNHNYNIIKNILIDSAGIKHNLSFYNRLKVKVFKLFKKLSSFIIFKRIFPNFEEFLKNNFGSSDYNNASPIMKKTLVKLINEDLTDELHKITAPTLLIWGEKDTATPLNDGKIMNEKIKDSGLVIYNKLSHFSFIEDKQKTILILKSFLNINN